jgi:hypothetical protein
LAILFFWGGSIFFIIPYFVIFFSIFRQRFYFCLKVILADRYFLSCVFLPEFLIFRIEIYF